MTLDGPQVKKVLGERGTEGVSLRRGGLGQEAAVLRLC